jgi:hypothetical protein
VVEWACAGIKADGDEVFWEGEMHVARDRLFVQTDRRLDGR